MDRRCLLDNDGKSCDWRVRDLGSAIVVLGWLTMNAHFMLLLLRCSFSQHSGLSIASSRFAVRVGFVCAFIDLPPTFVDSSRLRDLISAHCVGVVLASP
jgi:hypothetical protein